MQGRLSPQVNGRIQAFPWPYWQEEFATAAKLSFPLMEWTLDAERIDENPLMTDDGRSRIRFLMQTHSIGIPSLTGDCFMQEPFWKASSSAALGKTLNMFQRVVAACGKLGITHVVVPLVDAGSITSAGEESCFRDCLLECVPLLREQAVKVVVESDRPPPEQARLVDAFPKDCVGVNFDMGNSASLGWDPATEIHVLGERICHVHVKDRLAGGGTVPLGTGAVDFPRVFESLADIGYSGRFILQTARAHHGNHADVLTQYAAFISNFLAD